MSTYYVDPSGSNGTGTLVNPFNTFASLSLADGDIVAIKTGTTIREQFPAVSVNNLTITSYGTGDSPIISGADVVTSWTPVGGGIFSAALSNVGNVAENGEPLKWKAWTTDLATTALVPGSFSHDYNTNTLYVYPGGSITNQFEVSQRIYCISQTTAKSGLIVDGVHCRQAYRHGILLNNSTGAIIRNTRVSLCGGVWSGSKFLGNGVEITKGSDYAVVQDCVIEDVYDSAVTFQLYNVSAATLDGCVARRNVYRRCGLAGNEMSVQTANQSLRGCQDQNSNVQNIGSVGWLSLRTGQTPYGFGYINTAGSTSSVTGCAVIGGSASGVGIAVLHSNTNGSNADRGVFSDGCARGLRYSSSGTSMTATATGCVVRNSTIAALSTPGSASTTVSADNNVFEGNAIVLDRGNASLTFNFRNNIVLRNATVFSGSSGTLNESNNCVFSNTTIGKTLDGTDLTSDPSLRSDYVPTNSALYTAGTYLGGLDFYGKEFQSPPTIGAVQYQPNVSISLRQGITA